MTTADQSIEDEIQAKGLTAPRVTLADIQENVVDVEIHKHVTKSGQVLRWAILTTRCGFAVVGNPSCAVSSENDNEELGTKVAIDNSRGALWPLMGYELRQRLHDGAQSPALDVEFSASVAPPSTFLERLAVESSDLRECLEKLTAFIGTPAFHALPTTRAQNQLRDQRAAMIEYLDVLNECCGDLGVQASAAAPA